MILRGALGLHLVSSLLYPCRRSWFPFLGSSHSWFLFSSYLLCLSRRSCAQFFCCQFSFLGGWGGGFGGFLLCLLNNQAHLYSTARYLQLSTAEKGPFILPPLPSHLLSLLPGDPNHWAKSNPAQLVPRRKAKRELLPDLQSTSWWAEFLRFQV